MNARAHHLTIGALIVSLSVAIGLANGARADEPPLVLRFATPAPEGTAWARELHAFTEDVDRAMHGQVKLKLYLNGVTGDEYETLERTKKGQLDITGSGGMACEAAMPSIAVTRLLGVFQTREEAGHIAQTLRPLFEEEARQAGFELLGLNGMGADIVFTREPIRSFAEFRQRKLWRWNLDRTGSKMAKLMGIQIVPLPLETALPAYQRNEIDGFMAIPAGALAFQWSAHARYVLDLKTGFLEGCILMSQRAFDRLSPQQKIEFRAATAKFGLRWEALGAEQDQLILGGVLAKQGVRVVPTSDAFRAQYFSEAKMVREKLVEEGVIKRELVDRVMRALADFRAEHGAH